MKVTKKITIEGDPGEVAVLLREIMGKNDFSRIFDEEDFKPHSNGEDEEDVEDLPEEDKSTGDSSELWEKFQKMNYQELSDYLLYGREMELGTNLYRKLKRVHDGIYDGGNSNLATRLLRLALAYYGNVPVNVTHASSGMVGELSDTSANELKNSLNKTWRNLADVVDAYSLPINTANYVDEKTGEATEDFLGVILDFFPAELATDLRVIESEPEPENILAEDEMELLHLWERLLEMEIDELWERAEGKMAVEKEPANVEFFGKLGQADDALAERLLRLSIAAGEGIGSNILWFVQNRSPHAMKQTLSYTEGKKILAEHKNNPQSHGLYAVVDKCLLPIDVSKYPNEDDDENLMHELLKDIMRFFPTSPKKFVSKEEELTLAKTTWENLLKMKYDDLLKYSKLHGWTSETVEKLLEIFGSKEKATPYFKLSIAAKLGLPSEVTTNTIKFLSTDILEKVQKATRWGNLARIVRTYFLPINVADFYGVSKKASLDEFKQAITDAIPAERMEEEQKSKLWNRLKKMGFNRLCHYIHEEMNVAEDDPDIGVFVTEFSEDKTLAANLLRLAIADIEEIDTVKLENVELASVRMAKIAEKNDFTWEELCLLIHKHYLPIDITRFDAEEELLQLRNEIVKYFLVSPVDGEEDSFEEVEDLPEEDVKVKESLNVKIWESLKDMSYYELRKKALNVVLPARDEESDSVKGHINLERFDKLYMSFGDTNQITNLLRLALAAVLDIDSMRMEGEVLDEVMIETLDTIDDNDFDELCDIISSYCIPIDVTLFIEPHSQKTSLTDTVLKFAETNNKEEKNHSFRGSKEKLGIPSEEKFLGVNRVRGRRN